MTVVLQAQGLVKKFGGITAKFFDQALRLQHDGHD